MRPAKPTSISTSLGPGDRRGAGAQRNPSSVAAAPRARTNGAAGIAGRRTRHQTRGEQFAIAPGQQRAAVRRHRRWVAAVVQVKQHRPQLGAFARQRRDEADQSCRGGKRHRAACRRRATGQNCQPSIAGRAERLQHSPASRGGVCLGAAIQPDRNFVARAAPAATQSPTSTACVPPTVARRRPSHHATTRPASSNRVTSARSGATRRSIDVRGVPPNQTRRSSPTGTRAEALSGGKAAARLCQAASSTRGSSRNARVAIRQFRDRQAVATGQSPQAPERRTVEQAGSGKTVVQRGQIERPGGADPRGFERLLRRRFGAPPSWPWRSPRIRPSRCPPRQISSACGWPDRRQSGPTAAPPGPASAGTRSPVSATGPLWRSGGEQHLHQRGSRNDDAAVDRVVGEPVRLIGRQPRLVLDVCEAGTDAAAEQRVGAGRGGRRGRSGRWHPVGLALKRIERQIDEASRLRRQRGGGTGGWLGGIQGARGHRRKSTMAAGRVRRRRCDRDQRTARRDRAEHDSARSGPAAPRACGRK